MNSKVKSTLYEMLKDRNNDYCFKDINDNILLAYTENDHILIYNCQENKSGVKTINKLQEFVNEHKSSHVIFIYKNSITVFAKNAIKEFSETYNISIEMFYVNELMFNVTKHIFVPQHEILSDIEKRETMIRLRCKDIKKFPQMLTTDPVARYFNMKKGQLVRITRPSETCGKYISYRVVV
jgi:DNA-directed RNA polymerase I, II, and III subunit RPABC1